MSSIHPSSVPSTLFGGSQPAVNNNKSNNCNSTEPRYYLAQVGSFPSLPSTYGRRRSEGSTRPIFPGQPTEPTWVVPTEGRGCDYLGSETTTRPKRKKPTPTHHRYCRGASRLGLHQLSEYVLSPPHSHNHRLASLLYFSLVHCLPQSDLIPRRQEKSIPSEN